MKQLPLPFSFQETLPRVKGPISAKRIREAKAQIAAGDDQGALQNLIAIREKLEAFERRISNEPISAHQYINTLPHQL